MRRRLFISVLFLLAASAAQAQQQSPEAAPGISSRELARLRPAVLRDLKPFLRKMEGGEPTSADLDREFKACHFTALPLGKLGPAILVEAQAGHGMANAALLNLYVPDHAGYRRIVEAAGFGPEIVPGSLPEPDLVFGWASGVCHARYYRYRFKDGQYTPDACDQEVEGKDDNCAIERCEGGLPTFPHSSPGQ